MNITYRKLSTPSEFLEAVEVQKSAWRMDDYREAAPAHLLKGIADNGGLVLGAFKDGRLIGVSYGWPAQGYFYSHATGVIDDIKYRGIGRGLKLYQRKEVLSLGMDLVKWTFDPLQSLNSRFNLAKLGVIVKEYYENYYGEIRDSINRGLGSDRVKAEWYLTSNRVISIIKNKNKIDNKELYKKLERNSCKAIETSNMEPIYVDTTCNTDIILIEIPYNINELRRMNQKLPIAWRSATRKAYNHYINVRKYKLIYNIIINKKSFNILINEDLDKILETHPVTLIINKLAP
ncbi:MAG: hypothetical protein GSR85_11905 [Desulfurococcales archaeon]|nr:hypothetical protein [Desulfurococcales archaeon]